MRSMLVLATVLPLVTAAQDLTVRTFTYKPNLQADVYDLRGRSNQPVIVFIHGGALMMGNRGLSTNAGSLLHTLVTAGYAIVSIDYRLAPQVKLPAIIEDVQDACKWVREKGPELFRIKSDEIFVMGQSAGGYLTLMAGFKVEPRPRALVSFWGYGDIAGPWYSKPDPFYLQQPLVSKEEAERVGGGPLYLYCRQQGLWPKVLTGRDPHTVPAAFDLFCPVRNVTQGYPPTLLIHGDKDTDVPYEQSVLMAKELSRKGVPHEFITLTNVGHGIPRRETATAEKTYAEVVQFLDKHRKSVRMAGIVLKWIRTDKESNYRRVEPMIREAAANGAKIVCTTECFLDGYAIADKSIPLEQYRALGEPIPEGRHFKRLSALANELKIHVIAGFTEADGDARFNTAAVIGPAGELIGKYRKQKLQHEAVRNTAGKTSPVFDTAYGRIGVMICADRTEAGIVRGFCAAGADFLICPSGGMFGPKSNDPIVQARSRENQTHILFVHPAQFLVTGPDGSNLANTVLGDELLITPQEVGTEKDANRIFYFDLPLSTRAGTSFLGNKSLDGDARGRIPFWSEEQNDTLLSGKRAGQWRLDSDVKRSGATSVQLTPTGDWTGLSSVNYPLPGWTDAFELSGWARCDGAAMAQVLACWTDDEQKVVRVDASHSFEGRGEDWQRISLVPQSPPTNAMALRLVAAARGGKVWFDDFELLRLPPREKRLRVFVNQVGYELGGLKSAVIAANFLPTNETASVQLLTSEGKIAWKQEIPYTGRVNSGSTNDWGWYFWRVDFSSLRKENTYRAVAELGDVRTESFPFAVKRGVLLEETAQSAVDFFFIQRCGFDVPGWHKACHLDDAKLPDGTHLDATGGWHSAGDYNKLMYEHGDGGVVFALLAAYRAAPGVFKRFDRNGDGWPDALDEAEWGAKFVAKMQVSESGGVRNHLHQGPARQWTKWAAPELHTDNRIGTEDDPIITTGEGNSPLVIGGWARLSVLLKERRVQNDYLDRALRLWKYATKNGTQLGSPHLLVSTLQLYEVTDDPSHLDYVRRAAESLLPGEPGDLSAGALAHFALTSPRDSATAKVIEALRRYVDHRVGASDNPFGISKQTEQSFFPPDLGNNFQLLSRSWAASLIYQVTGDERALRYAVDHLDWVLGKNPLNLCMFEGKGSFNPPRYHHRYNAIAGRERGAVPGAIPNGFVRDMGLADRPGFDLSRGGNRSPSYRTSEPWLVHNLYYLLAASALHKAVAR